MTPFDAVLTQLRKEREMIRQAPLSFAIVCAIALGFIWTGFHYVYRGALEDATRDAAHWKNNSEYWEDQTKHVASKPTSPANPSCLPVPGRDDPGWTSQKEATRLSAKFEMEHPESVGKPEHIKWVNQQLESECVGFVVTQISVTPSLSTHHQAAPKTAKTSGAIGIIGGKVNDMDDTHISGFKTGIDLSHSDKSTLRHTTITAPGEKPSVPPKQP
jgi:hypothetical protein